MSPVYQLGSVQRAHFSYFRLARRLASITESRINFSVFTNNNQKRVLSAKYLPTRRHSPNSHAANEPLAFRSFVFTSLPTSLSVHVFLVGTINLYGSTFRCFTYSACFCVLSLIDTTVKLCTLCIECAQECLSDKQHKGAHEIPSCLVPRSSIALLIDK